MLAANGGQTAQPLGPGGIDSTLALNGLNDHTSGMIQIAAAIGQGIGENVERIDNLTHCAIVGHEDRIMKAYTRARG